MHKINRIHEGSLRLLLNNYTDGFQNLLNIAGDISIHQRCINFLLTEVYKYIHGLSPEIMNDVFSVRANVYNICNYNLFRTQIPHSNKYGLKSLQYSLYLYLLPKFSKNRLQRFIPYFLEP